MGIYISIECQPLQRMEMEIVLRLPALKGRSSKWVENYKGEDLGVLTPWTHLTFQQEIRGLLLLEFITMQAADKPSSRDVLDITIRPTAGNIAEFVLRVLQRSLLRSCIRHHVDESKQVELSYIHNLLSELKEAKVDIQTLPELPDGSIGILTKKLDAYQSQGVQWLLDRENPDQRLTPSEREFAKAMEHPYSSELQARGGILGDDMGLGKTPQIIALIAATQDLDDLSHKTLIVCPKSVIGNWLESFAKFTGDKIKVCGLHRGYDHTQIEGGHAVERARDAHVCVINYDLLDRSYPEDGMRLNKDLPSISRVRTRGTDKDVPTIHVFDKWHRIVLDEAHVIAHAKRSTNNYFKLNANIKWCVTGTPIQNRREEIFNLLYFVGLIPYADEAFMKKYFRKKSATPELLRAVIEKYMLRRLKSTKLGGEPILPLNPKIPDPIPLELPMELWDIYNDPIIQHANEFNRMHREQWVCSCPRNLLEHFSRNKNKQKKLTTAIKNHPKRIELLARVSEIVDGKGKVVVFCRYKETLAWINEILAQYNPIFLVSEMSTDERSDAVSRFQDPDSKANVFVTTTRVGGVGITLTSAATVIIFEMDWNPAIHDQSIDRVYRRGQTEDVRVVIIYCKGTIEEKILRTQMTKKKKTTDIYSLDIEDDWNEDMEGPDEEEEEKKKKEVEASPGKRRSGRRKG